MAVPTLVFLRHGETDWNAEARLQGQRDIPLNERGRAQARRNGEAIARELPEAADFDFVASTLGRARETMEIVRGQLGLETNAYGLDTRLHEVTFGDWEGLTFPEIEAREPGGVARREADKWRFLPPNGESYEMLSARACEWLNGLSRPTVMVSHGGIVRVLLIRLAGMAPMEAMGWQVPQDEVFLWRDGTLSRF